MRSCNLIEPISVLEHEGTEYPLNVVLFSPEASINVKSEVEIYFNAKHYRHAAQTSLSRGT